MELKPTEDLGKIEWYRQIGDGRLYEDGGIFVSHAEMAVMGGWKAAEQS